jgi:ATP-dependent Clp protease ATP-binding subunit ClpB
MDLEKFTTKSQEVIQNAQQLAVQAKHQQIDVWHLLLALATQEGSVVPTIFSKLQIDENTLLNEIQAELGKKPTVTGDIDTNKVYASQEISKTIEGAFDEAKKWVMSTFLLNIFY